MNMSAASIELRDFKFQGNGNENENQTNWRKGNQIGCGGFSNVYRAEIDMHGETRTIAVKVINVSQNEKDTKKKKSVLAEIEALKKLHHERIVSYYGFSEMKFESFIFMEYIQEGSLRQYLCANGRLNIDRIKHFTQQLLQGVEYLHGLQCVHRDIKPENVLIKGKNIKLTDFGLSRFFDEISKTYTAFIGTIRYMAPELFQKDKSNSNSVDIWATGCVVLEMATGEFPFHTLDQMPLSGLMVSKKISPLDKEYMDAELPKEIENFLSKIFIYDAKKRPTASFLLKDTFLTEHKETQTSFDCADGDLLDISNEDNEEPSISSAFLKKEPIGSQKKMQQGDSSKQIKEKSTQTTNIQDVKKRKVSHDELTTSTTSINKMELRNEDVKKRKTSRKPSNEKKSTSSTTEYTCCSEFIKTKVLKKHQGKKICMAKWPTIKKKVLNEDYLKAKFEPEFTSSPTSNRAFFSLACKKFITLTCGSRSHVKDPPKCVLDAIYGKFPCSKKNN